MTILQAIGLVTLLSGTYKLGAKRGYKKGYKEGKEHGKELTNDEAADVLQNLIDKLNKTEKERLI